MGREDIKAGRAFVELGVSDKMAAGLNAASRRLRAFGGAVRNIGAGVLGAGVAILAPVAMATRQYAAYGDHLQKLSLRLGIGVRDLSLFHHAAKMAGIESRTFDMAMQRMTRRVAEAAQGTGEAKDAIRTLGLDAAALAAVGPAESLLRVAGALSAVTDQGERVRLAFKLFDSEGVSLVQMLGQGRGALEDVMVAAERAGLAISDTEAAGAARLTDALARLRDTVRRLSVSVGDALAPVLTVVVERLRQGWQTASVLVKQNRDLVVVVVSAVAAVAGLGAALLAAGVAIQVAGFALGGIAKALVLVKAAMLATVSPIALVAAGVVALAVVFREHIPAVGRLVGWLGDCLRWLQDRVGDVLGGIRAAFEAGDLALAAKIAWLGVKVAALSAMQSMKGHWEDFRVFVVTAMVGVGGRLVALWERTAYSFRRIWTKVQYWFARMVLEISGAWSKAWENVWAFWTNKILGSKVFQVLLVGRTLTSEEEAYARDQNADLQQAAVEGIRSEKAAALASLEHEHIRTLGELGAEHVENLAQLKATLERAEDAALMAAGAGEIREANTALADAKAELSKAVASAKQAAEEAAMPAAMPATPGLAAEIQRREAAVGTFNPAATWGISGVSVWDRIARATEETAANTRQGGGRFSP